MKFTINASTVDLLNNMAAVELDHHGVAPADIAEIIKVEQVTHLKHIRIERVGNVWEYEVSDEAIVNILHLYARAARIIVPLVKPIAFAIKGFFKGIDQLKELMPHMREIEAMAEERITRIDGYDAATTTRFEFMDDKMRSDLHATRLDAQLNAHDVELHNLRAARADLQPDDILLDELITTDPAAINAHRTLMDAQVQRAADELRALRINTSI